MRNKLPLLSTERMRLESHIEKKEQESETVERINCICGCIICVIGSGLFIVACIFLAGTNHSEYFKACGHNLWDAVAAVVSFVPIALFIICVFGCIYGCCYKFDQDTINKSFTGFTIIYHLIAGICLLVFYTAAHNNPDCLKAMTAGNYTNTTATNSTFTAESAKGLAYIGLAYGIIFVISTSAGIVFVCVNTYCPGPQRR